MRSSGSPEDQPPERPGGAAESALSVSFSDYVALSQSPPDRRPKADAIRRARWLVVFVCLALLATNAWLIVDARAHAIAQAALASTNLARAVTERVEGTVSEIEHILDGIVFELERSDLTPRVLERMQPILVHHVAAVEQIKGIFIYDAQGKWIASSEPTWDPAANNADRPYFKHHRSNPSAKALIGAPIVSRSSGEWVVPVSRRLNDPDGDFVGVALVTLRLQYLRNLLDKFDVGGEGAIALFLADRIMVRRPFKETDLGSPLPQTPLKALLDATPAGTADARSTLDGVWRLISFERTRNYPILVTVAVSKEEVLRSWRTASMLQTGWALFLCLVLGLAGLYVNRSMRRRLKAESGLRATRDALAQANARLAHMAQYDGLTGLPNRRYFDSRLIKYFKQAQRERSCIAVVMVDVDEFKKYNDHYGHVEGDQCLKRVAEALSATAQRPIDLVARYGGEEMVLLLPGTDAAGAVLLAQAARRAVVDQNIPHVATALGKVSVSLGVAACMPGPADTPNALLKAADAALYQAKKNGRNRVYPAH
ncbi:GGDEF domain-containing protein [Pseudorhodoferax sp. Leaf267]|uniref:GGDEF domain-containing protein n=1 Tax=Pseudorhodoferax sp. Leaf267 TaxID=1736316 RepID=UPI0009EB6AA5|nr:GGDEF domain-containing protein [Pseudorhodoferax sp. Leaf267]